MTTNFFVIAVLLIAFLVYVHLGYKSNSGIRKDGCEQQEQELKTAKRWKRTATIVAVGIAIVSSLVNWILWK